MSVFHNQIQEIYCDESGFTGNNLLDKETPFFAYSSVAVSNEEAKDYVQKIIQDYKVQAGELKFQKLIKYSKGRQAIEHILATFSDRAKVTVHNKKYNLACKFYEYVFEPTIASKSSILYNLGFHRFISHLLYLHFQSKSDYAEEIFKDFYDLMRVKDDAGLVYLFSSLSLPNISPVLDAIREFCVHQRDAINEELDSLKGTGTGKWILDLTHTSLFSLLGEWGQEFNQIEVFCDASKPLQEQVEIFQVMVNKDEKLFMELAGQQHAISFNLASLPQLVDSQSRPGIQIADVLAGTFAFVFRENLKSNYNSYPQEWIPYLDKCISPYSVIPDPKEHLDWTKINVKRNYLILEELTERSIRNASLLDGIDIFLAQITHYLSMNPSI
jgi:hypothetical protein